MNSLERYLCRIARAEARRPRLEDALITGRGGDYAAYRLRFLLLRTLLRAALHLVEILILLPLLTDGLLAPVLGVRVATMIASALMWGGLEELRESVRTCGQKGQWSKAARHMESWLSASSIVGIATTSMTVLILLAVSKAESITAMDLEAYISACVLRLAIECIARTYHSGLYALRRIRRPLWSLLLVDFLDIAMILLFWSLGFLFWSLSISMISVGIIKAALLFWFVRAAHRSSFVPSLRIRKIALSFLRLQWSGLVSFFRYAAANLFSQLDGLLLIVLASVSSRSESGIMLFLCVYLLRPFLAAGQSALRLFYFDFIILRDHYCDFIRRRFDGFMRRTALATAVILNVMSLFWIAAVVPFATNIPSGDPIRHELLQFSAVLIPFSAVRTWFGWRQTQAFAWAKHGYILRLTGIITLGALPLFCFIENGLVLMVTMSLLIGAALYFLPAPRISPDQPSVHRAVSLPRFVASIQNPAHVQIGFGRVDTRVASVARVFHNLLIRFPEIKVTRIDHSAFLWKSEKGIAIAELARSCSGAIRNAEIQHFKGSESSSWISMLGSNTHVSNLLKKASSAPVDLRQLISEFSRFSDGRTISVSQEMTESVGNLQIPMMSIRRVLRTISKTGYSGLVHRFDAGPFDMTIFCPKGEPETIFLIPKTEPVEKRVAWADEVFRASLAASIANSNEEKSPSVPLFQRGKRK